MTRQDVSTPAFPVTMAQHMLEMERAFVGDVDLDKILRPAYYDLTKWRYPDEMLETIRRLCDGMEEEKKAAAIATPNNNKKHEQTAVLDRSWIASAARVVLFPFQYSEKAAFIFEELLGFWTHEYFSKTRAELEEVLASEESSSSLPSTATLAPSPHALETCVLESLYLTTGPRSRIFRCKQNLLPIKGCRALVVMLRMAARGAHQFSEATSTTRIKLNQIHRRKVAAELVGNGIRHARSGLNVVSDTLNASMRAAAPTESVPFLQPALDRPTVWSSPTSDPRRDHPTIETQRLLYKHGVEVRAQPRSEDPGSCMNLVLFPGEGTFASDEDEHTAMKLIGGEEQRRITHLGNDELRTDMMRMYSTELGGRVTCYDIMELTAWMLWRAELVSLSSGSKRTASRAHIRKANKEEKTDEDEDELKMNNEIEAAGRCKFAVAHAFVTSRGWKLAGGGGGGAENGSTRRLEGVHRRVAALRAYSPSLSIHEIVEGLVRALSANRKISAELLLQGASLKLPPNVDPLLAWKIWADAARDMPHFPQTTSAATVMPMSRHQADRISKWLAAYLSLNRIRYGKLMGEDDFHRLGSLGAHLMPEAIVRSEMGMFSRLGRRLYDTVNYATGPVLRITERYLRSPEYIVAAQIVLYLLESLMCFVTKMIRVANISNPLSWPWADLVSILWHNLGSFLQASFRLAQIIRDPANNNSLLGYAFDSMLTLIGLGNMGFMYTGFQKLLPHVHVGKSVALISGVMGMGLQFYGQTGIGTTIDEAKDVFVNMQKFKEFFRWCFNIVQYIPFVNDMTAFLGFLDEFKQTFANRVDHLTTLSATQTMLSIKFFCRFSVFLNVIDMATGNLCQNLMDLLSRIFGLVSVHAWVLKIVYNITAFFVGWPYAGTSCFSDASIVDFKLSHRSYVGATGNPVTASTNMNAHDIFQQRK